ncbi:MAG: response regulator [Thermoplasmatota archaeon]
MTIKALLVDDERSLLDQAKIFLEKVDQELEIMGIHSPQKALDVLAEDDPDVIISDYQMPGMDGLEFLKIIREDKHNKIPFIIFTGKGREEVAMKALNLGADRYLQKGGDVKTQYEVLAQAIEQEANHFRTKQRRKETEERYRRLFENAEYGILLLDAETGKIKETNPHFQDLLGYSKEELIGKRIWELGTFKSMIENRKEFNELIEQGYIRDEDKLLKTKAGYEVPVEFVSNTYKARVKTFVECNIREISKD